MSVDSRVLRLVKGRFEQKIDDSSVVQLLQKQLGMAERSLNFQVALELQQVADQSSVDAESTGRELVGTEAAKQQPHCDVAAVRKIAQVVQQHAAVLEFDNSQTVANVCCAADAWVGCIELFHNSVKRRKADEE